VFIVSGSVFGSVTAKTSCELFTATPVLVVALGCRVVVVMKNASIGFAALSAALSEMAITSLRSDIAALKGLVSCDQ